MQRGAHHRRSRNLFDSVEHRANGLWQLRSVPLFKKQPHETVCFLKEALSRNDSLVTLGHVTRSFLEVFSDSMTQSSEARVTRFQLFRKKQTVSCGCFFLKG
jgi:hypothetical protein